MTCRLPPVHPLALLLASLLAGCQPQGAAPGDTGTERASPPAGPSTGAAGALLRPCELAPQALVHAVLPEAGEGATQQTGGSLIKGIDSYQCSYVNRAGELLTVIVHVASSADLFKEIVIGSEVREHYRRVDVGDEGWVQSSADEGKLKASKKLQRIELNLLASGAAGREAQLVELARAIAQRL